MELTPKTRKETFLAAAGGQDITTPTTVTREEVFLDAIAKGGGGGGSSGGGVLVVNVTEPEADLYVCDKTAGEMLAACKTGIVVFVETGESEEKVAVCTSASLDDMGYLFKRGTANYGYSASSSTDYPTYDDR